MFSKKIYFIGLLVLAVAAYVGFGFTETTEMNAVSQGEKQKGAHVFGGLDSTSFESLRRNNFDWITLVPYGDQASYDSPFMTSQWGDSIKTIQRNSEWLNQINKAHKAGFKVFVKPHIWMHSDSEGKWRSDIYPTDDKNWELWKESYRKFIFRYARIAEEGKAEMFCIGTELLRLSLEKTEFWRTLIKEVRTIYSGKITYAANWYKEYEKITFWDELDYIGVQAYFPLVKKENPSVEQIVKGWGKHIPNLQKVSKKYNRSILFTELGYKSTRDAAITPWEWIDYSENADQRLSLETQANCYDGFFHVVWQEEWFAGIHLWQWSTRNKHRDPNQNLDFTPQGKPAEKVLARGFK